MVRLPLAVLATAGPLPAAPPPDPVALARGGTALWPVVVAEDASPRIRTTAADLAGYLGTIAGATFEVTTGDGTTGLAVGLPAQFPALPVAGRWARPAVAEREDYLLHTHPRSVYLLGATEQGVEHAVWDFLHRLGYRQFFPGPRWEVVPRRPVLSAAVDVEETPAYRSRRIWYGAGLWDDNAELYRLWCVRDRATGGTQLNTGHSYGRIIQALQTEFDAHPEYDRPTHRRPEAAGLGGQEVYRQPGSAPARGGVDQGNYTARGRIVRIVWEGEAPAEPLVLTARREPRPPGHRRSEPRAVYVGRTGTGRARRIPPRTSSTAATQVCPTIEPGRRPTSRGAVCMAIPAQATRLGVWVLVGMTFSSSLACSRPASVQPSSQVARLMTQLQDKSPTVRRAAAEALVRLRPAAQDAAPELVKLLKDPEAGVRLTASMVLRELGPAAQDVVPELAKLLKDPDRGVRLAAAYALGGLGVAAKDTVSDLVELLKDPDGDMRRVAAEALGGLGPVAKDAVPALAKFLKDPDWGVRWAAAHALGRLGHVAQDVVPALVKLLKDPEAAVRQEAASALSELGPAAKDTVSDLVKLLKDPDEEVRRDAAWLLGRIGPAAQDAVPDLVELLKDPVVLVRWEAASALGQIGLAAQDVVPELAKLLEDPDADVRRAAAAALSKIGAGAKDAVKDEPN